MAGDGADHEVRAVADVGIRAEENGGHADGDEDRVELRVAGIGASDRRGKTGEISRRIVEDAREDSARPIVSADVRMPEQLLGVGFQPLQSWHHGQKDCGKEDDDLDHRMPIVVIGFVDAFVRGEPRDCGCGDHDEFA